MEGTCRREGATMFGKAKKETGAPTAVPPNGDDALFEALGKSRKAKKRKILRTVLIIAVVLVAALIAGVSILQRQVRKQFASSSQEVLRAAAERGTISTVVSGFGTLTNVDTETVSVPSGVEVTEILVEFGDTVKEGDLLATVDMASVRTAMSDLQGEIENLDDQIADADGDTVSSYVSAGVPGRVKAIYAEKGKLVEDVMVEHGGLAEISLDGCMAADIETDALSEGDRVTVVLSDGEEMGGTVEKTVGGTATVLVTDNGPENGEAVTVKSESGAELGSGTLYIHNALTVTGYAGTVSTVDAVLNQKVYASTTLFTLKDTSTSASYDALLRERSEKEETLLKLLQIQRSNGLTAPISGSVYSVADLDDEDGEEITDIVVLSPDVSMSVTISVDEADILALELGQEADVTVSSVSDETLSGVVTEIDKTSASGDYTAVITLDKVTGMLPGMTASVDVRIEGVDDAILIPVDALHQTSSGYYVYTSYDEDTQEYGGKVDVVPGLSNGNYVEIKSGLSEGDVVYYTESQTFDFGGMGFGGMPGDFGGDMPDMSGSSGGGMPSGGAPSGGPGGGMPGGRG